MPSPFVRVVAVLAVGTLGLLACSSDDAGAPSATEAPSTPVTDAPTTTEPPSEDTAAPDATDPATTDPATTEPATTEPDVRPTPTVGEPVATLEELVDLAVRPGDDTMYLVERAGRVTTMVDGEVGTAVLDISDLTENGGEQGFLGLAFGPEGDTAYVNYTDNAGDTVIAEYAVAEDGTFDEASERTLMTIEQPYPNHNGGDLAFGPDGYLYIGTGDGGAADDPERRSLDVTSPLGKFLRIDPAPDGDQPYTVPADNPYLDVDDALPELYMVGVRNPWRFSFDPATGDLWVADVGQNVWEEINHLPATADMPAGYGVSLGWSAYEGEVRFNEDQDGADPLGGEPVAPIHVYEHGDAGCSVSGGEVYRGSAIAGLDGWYVFGDFCSGKVWALEVLDDGTAGEVMEIGNVPSLTAVAAGPDGELWTLALDGTLRPILPA